MLIRKAFNYNDKEFAQITSDAHHAVVCAGEKYITISMLTSEEKPCTEGDLIPDNDITTDEALTRYANELTGENDPDLVSATESLIIKFTEE